MARRVAAFTPATAHVLADIAHAQISTPTPGLTTGVAPLESFRRPRYITIDGTAGQPISSSPAGYWPGKVLKVDIGREFETDEPYSDGVPIWVVVLNKYSGSSSVAVKLTAGERYLAEPMGYRDLADGTGPRPMYVLWHSNRIWPVTIPTDLADGATGSIGLPDGRTVAYKAQGKAKAGGGTVYQAESDGEFYLVGGGGSDEDPATDKEAIVAPYGANAETNCLWVGKIEALTGTPTTFCADHFGAAGDCWLLVMNHDGGSTDSSDKVTLNPNERYLGRKVGTLELLPVYAIRVDDTTHDIMVRATSTTKSIGTACLWDGVIQTMPVAPGSFCFLTAEQFGDGAECYILVLNATIGSRSNVNAEIYLDDRYIGRRIGSYGGRPLIAIRVEDNYTYIGQATNDIPGRVGAVDGGSSIQSLPNGGTVPAFNRGLLPIFMNDSILLTHDLMQNKWFAMPFPLGTLVLKDTLSADLVASDPTAIVGGFGATNDLHLCGKTGETCYTINDVNNRQLRLLAVDQKRANLITFRFLNAMRTGDALSTGAIVLEFFDGIDPDPASAGITVYNMATDYSGVYKFDAEANAVGYAQWNETIGGYFITAVEGEGRRWVLFRNDTGGGVTIPALGIMQQTLAGTLNLNGGHTYTRPVLSCSRPSVVFPQAIWVNGYASVADGAVGVCHSSEGPHEITLYSAGPAIGDTVGISPSQFTALHGSPGFTYLGTVTSGAGIHAYVKPQHNYRLLAKMTSSVLGTLNYTNNPPIPATTTLYKIYVGGTPGSEADAGWTTVPTARIRNGMPLFVDTPCWLTRVNNEWSIEACRTQTAFIGITSTLLNAAATCTVRLWYREHYGAGSLVDSGLDVTALDWLLKPAAGSLSQLAIGTKVVVTFIDGWFYVTEAQCA